MEDRIKELCAEEVATPESPELNEILKQLQAALSEHTLRMRRLAAELPFRAKRRSADSPAFSFSLTGDRLTRIKNDAEFLWCYGMIQYRDVYEREHETRFCYRYIVPPEERESN